MRRFLLLFLAALAIFWWLGKLLRGARKVQPGSARAATGGEVATGQMVRDRVCNTFLPREKALRLESGAEEHFFCSETCRDRFLASRPRSES